MQYSLYLHIPFCRSKCRYCDFYSAPASHEVPDEYINALLQGFSTLAPKDKNGQPLPPATVYFGGGTPGLLSPAQVLRILQTVHPQNSAEITLEANPEGCTTEKLCGWHSAGVNRLSLGVQTANAASLARLGRLHTPAGALAALQNARKAGFTNVSADIMLALPEYSTSEFDETLALIKEGDAAHISAYMLSLEENTPFGKNPPQNTPSADQAGDFYLYACSRLQNAGYHQYEISNFARPGFAGKHNLVYWDSGNWLGLGPSAHSCMGGARFSFAPNTAMFCANPQNTQAEGTLTPQDYIMLRLRLAQGISTNALQTRFGTSFSATQQGFLTQLCTRGLAKKTTGGWALTPKGMLVQNSILTQLL